MSAFKLFRQGAPRPSLKERAASLKAMAARLVKRQSGEITADQGRRMMVVGSVAAAVGAPLPVLAGAALPVAEPHPDQALFDAETAYLAAREAEIAAQEASSRAWDAYWIVVGDLPLVLVAPRWARSDTAHPNMPLRREGVYLAGALTPDRERVAIWTAKSLRRTISAMPRIYGRAGTTPKIIRSLRAILPVAEAYEARMADANARFGVREAQDKTDDAREAVRLSRCIIREAMATTPAGLAVKVRQVAEGDWLKADNAVGGLIRSAALVAGVPLIHPSADFDAAGWVTAWEGIGGRALKGEPGSGPNFYCPLNVAPERAAVVNGELTRLIRLLEEHRDAISRYVQARG